VAPWPSPELYIALSAENVTPVWHNLAMESGGTDIRLDQIRGALPRAATSARSVAALTQNPGCTRRRVIDSAGVAAHDLAARLGRPTPRGQSPFAIAGGNRFEDRLKHLSDYMDLVVALEPYVDLPQPPDLVIEDVNHVGRR
jgi:hypothetical protein